MPLETNFNTPPYFDDYNANNNYHRILFRPSTAVQARELTQLQTILQDQVEKFGSHIFKDGTAVEGCTINFDSNYNYVKVLDNYANGSSFNISDFIGKKAVGENGLEAYIVNAVPGYETDAPDLNTLYVKYLNSASYPNTAPQKLFDANETIEIRTTANVLFGTITAGNGTVNAVGTGYAISISEGTIFQKGFFIGVQPQTLIVSKYNNQPNSVSVGFKTSEIIVTAEADGTLYDNALGSSNFNAPGANRLKLTANLVTRDTASISNTDNFFSIVDFEDGQPVTIRTSPQYASLGAEMARRTYEESGNYIIDPFELYLTSNTANTNALTLEVDKGLGYVAGYRVEYLNKKRTSIRKGLDVAYYDNQIVTANYGSYVYVDEAAGIANLKGLATVDLYDTASDTITNSRFGSAPLGTKIGTATIRTLTYYSGTVGTPTAQYKAFIFNIKMDSTRSFRDVRSIYGEYVVSGVTRKFYADTVLDIISGATELREVGGSQLVVGLGKRAVRNLRNANGLNNTSFTYRTQKDITFQANGTATFSLDTPHSGTSGESFAQTGALSEGNESKFIVVARGNATSANVSGSANIASGSNVIRGSGTSFNTDFVIGDFVAIANTTANGTFRVTTIANATYMEVSPSANSTTAVQFNGNVAIYYPNGSIISLSRDDTANVNVTSNTTAEIKLSRTFSGTSTLDATVYYDVTRAGADPATKTVNKSRLVKIDTATHSANTTGPWSLGLPDVYKLRAVYQGTTYSNTNTNQVANFVLDNGQRDSHYDLASIAIKPGSGHTVGATDKLLVEFDHFTQDTTDGIGYFAVTSYRIDDANTANTTAITTQEIPVYTSTVSGIQFDLRDCVDFRPYVAGTAVSTQTVASATENPSANGTFSLSSVGAYTVTPDSNFNTNFSFYLGRKDKVAISPQGKIINIEGTPSVDPQAPKDAEGTMALGALTIPPYPSLSQADARQYARSDYGVDISLTQNRRYTMRDIGNIDRKVDRLEYYTSLSLLEASAKTLLLKDSTGADRFKNGFLVEPFKGFAIADTNSSEFKAAIDPKVQEMAPTIKRTYVDLDFDSVNSSGVVKSNNIITLSKTDTPYITQRFASKYRNCVENIVYVWKGNIALTPEGDVEPDVTIGPDIVTNVDLNGASVLPNGINNIIGTERIVGTSAIINAFFNTNTQRTIAATNAFTSLRNNLDFSATTVNNTFNFGQVVQDVSVQMFVRPRMVGFVATGLRPNTRVYPFFDNINVSEYCFPLTNQSAQPVTGAAFSSGNLVTSSTGEIRGFFFIPAGTFKVGNRTFTLADVDDLDTNAEAITTRGSATYTASNIAVAKSNVSLNTRVPQLAVTSTRPPTVVTQSPNSAPSAPVDEGGGGDITDPICQTIMINEPTSVAGVFISKIDLYFQKKDPVFGIEIQVREVENGFPTTRIVPFGRKILTSAECSVSADASAATTFTFDSPVFLESGREYCFVVMPIGNSINWNIWCGEVGGTDVTTGSPIFVNNFTGVLFTSSTNRVWTPIQKEDIKFVIHRAQFSSSTGTIKYTNSNTEYLSASNFKGKFTVGEKVYVSNGIVTVGSNVSFNTTTAATTINLGNGVANAQAVFTAGNRVYLSANDGAITNIRTIASVPNATHITVSSNLSFSDSNASIGFLKSNGELYGYAYRVAATANSIHLEKSSATSVTNFVSAVTASANAILIGESSGARANLVSVDSVLYSTVIPQFSYVAPAGTTAAVSIQGWNNTLDSSTTQTTPDIETFFTDKERYVLSRSRELATYSGTKSIQVTVPVYSENTKISPMFDDIKSDIIVIQNNISNTASIVGEDTRSGGNTSAKYISKRVVLAEGQDAEDLIVYLSAYKPANTDIKVYCKLLNAGDSEPFDTKAWSPMIQTTSTNVVSSRVQREDIKEFEYKIQSITSTTDITNATANRHAFIDSSSNTVVKYYSNANSYFYGFKTFAIKIVLTSDEGTHLVPRVSDMRAIALQAY